MRIELRTPDNAVLTTHIPDLGEAPGVILWGTRVFAYTATADAYPHMDREPTHIYCEAEPYAIGDIIESRSNA